jgi:RNA polymerase sigma-70 factor (ECF subfamily)
MPGSPDERVLLDLLRKGDEEAARKLFNAYAERLLSLARWRISQRMARRVDPEDIVQSVFRTFFTRVKSGHLTFEEQDDLSKLLVSITVRKTLRQIAFHRAAKRDPAMEVAQDDSSAQSLPDVESVEPSPEAEVVFVDLLEHFLARLEPRDRQILELRLQGYRTAEIAEKLNILDRTVRRTFEQIRAAAENDDDLTS